MKRRLPQCPTCRGGIFSQSQGRGLLFAELVHPAHQAIPTHTHRSAFYHLTLMGSYDESTTRRTESFPSFSSAFIAGDTRHHAKISRVGAHLFAVEFAASWTRDLEDLRGARGTALDTAGAALTCLGIKLYREYKTGRGANLLTIESLVWELLGAAVSLRHEKLTKAPSWWPRIVELLRSEFRRQWRVTELAREAGVHPVHLARVFRRLTKQTAGECVQHLRVEQACRQLTGSGQEIAAIAFELGFADQSHFTRALKKHTALTPAAFRRSFSPQAISRH